MDDTYQITPGSFSRKVGSNGRRKNDLCARDVQTCGKEDHGRLKNWMSARKTSGAWIGRISLTGRRRDGLIMTMGDAEMVKPDGIDEGDMDRRV